MRLFITTIFSHPAQFHQGAHPRSRCCVRTLHLVRKNAPQRRAPFYHDDFQSSRAIPSRRTSSKRVLRAHAPFSKGKRPATPRAFLSRRFPGLTAQFHQGAHPRSMCCERTLHLVRENAPERRAPFYHDDFQSSRAIPPRRTPAKRVLRAHAPFSKGKRSVMSRAPVPKYDKIQ